MIHESGNISSSSKKSLHWAAEKERFLKVDRVWNQGIISKECITLGKVAILRRQFLLVTL